MIIGLMKWLNVCKEVEKLKKELTLCIMEREHVIVLGDWNAVPIPSMDRSSKRMERTEISLFNHITNLNLTDTA